MSENTCMLPLPIELRENIYGHFVQQHTIDERMKYELQYHCAKIWIEKMWNGFKREESSRKLYAMNDFFSMMINDMGQDLTQKMELALYWHRGSKDSPIQTSDMDFYPAWKNRRKFSERTENKISFV